jgi:hypothetical protein
VRFTVDRGQYEDKSSYYHNFKTQLGDQPGVRSRSRVRRVIRVDSGQHKIKIIIIIVLKLISGVNPGQDPGHGLGVSTWVNIKIKIIIIIVLKLELRVD